MRTKMSLGLCKTPVYIVDVCSSQSDNARPWCDRTQLTTTFVGDQLAVGGQIVYPHFGELFPSFYQPIVCVCVCECCAVDGASFSLSDRGPCRCIQAELVCAKSQVAYEPKAGRRFTLFQSSTRSQAVARTANRTASQQSETIHSNW